MKPNKSEFTAFLPAKKTGALALIFAFAMLAAMACGGAAATPQVVEKIVEKEVIKEVVKEVEKEVVKEVVKEKIVIATAVPGIAAPEIRRDPLAKTGGVLKTGAGSTPGTWDVNQSPSSSVLSPVGPRLEGVIKVNPFDRGLTIVPGLAHAWEVSDDGLLITFHLRDNARFHDGTSVTPDDVVASWTRIHAPPEGVLSYRKDWFSRIEEVKAVDDLTVEFVFGETSAEILRFIASDWNAVFPKAVLEEYDNDLGSYVMHPAAGPFQMAELKAGEVIRYEKFQDYWNEGLPYLDGIEIHLLGSGRFAAFLVGQLDTVQVNNPVDYQLALDKGVQGERAVVPIARAIYFNLNVEPFDDVRVRQAIDLVIDRDELAAVSADVTYPAKGQWAPPGNAYALSDSELGDLPAYSPDREARVTQAKALLAEAGYPDGFTAHMTVGSPQSIVVTSEFFQAVLRDTLNINLELETLDWSVWIARAKERQFNITAGAQFTTLHDPSDFMNVFWRTGGAQNWSGWSSPEFDAIMDQVDTELDPVKRKELVLQAYKVLDKEMPQVTGAWGVDGHMWWPYVKGFPSRGPALGRYVYFDRQTLWLDR